MFFLYFWIATCICKTDTASSCIGERGVASKNNFRSDLDGLYHRVNYVCFGMRQAPSRAFFMKSQSVLLINTDLNSSNFTPSFKTVLTNFDINKRGVRGMSSAYLTTGVKVSYSEFYLGVTFLRVSKH